MASETQQRVRQKGGVHVTPCLTATALVTEDQDAGTCNTDLPRQELAAIAALTPGVERTREYVEGGCPCRRICCATPFPYLLCFSPGRSCRTFQCAHRS